MPKTTWLLALPYPALFALVYYYNDTYNFIAPFAFLLLGILFLFGCLSLIASEGKKTALYANLISLALSLGLFYGLPSALLEASLDSSLSFKGLIFTLIGLFILMQGVVFLLVPKSQKKAPYLPKKAWLRDTPTKRLLWLNLIPYPLLFCLSLNQLSAMSLLNALLLLGLFCFGTYGLFKIGEAKHFLFLSGLNCLVLYDFDILFRFSKTIFINGKVYASFSDLESAMFLLFLLLFIVQGLCLMVGLKYRKNPSPPPKSSLLDYFLWLNGLSFPALFYFHRFILEGQIKSEALYFIEASLAFLLLLGALALYRRLHFKDYLFALISILVTSFELAVLSLKKLFFLIPYPEGLGYTEPILSLYFITILSLACLLFQGGLLLIRTALAYLKSDPK